MKTVYISLFLFATLTSSAWAAQPAATAAARALAPEVTPRRIANGMTRAEVIASAGQPGAMLDANVWAYWNFTARGVPASEKLDTLLVVFTGDRVKFFKFVAEEPVRAFLAQRTYAESKGRSETVPLK